MRRYVFRLAVLAFAVLGPTLAYGNDTQIAQTIVQKLQQEKKAGSLKGFTIDLQVEEGTVWLTGNVANAQQQARALDLARRVPGVKQVVNDLSIATAAAPGSSPASLSDKVATSAVQPVSATAEQPRQARSIMAQRGEVGSGVSSMRSTYVAAPAPAAAPVQMMPAPQQMAMPMQGYMVPTNPVPFTYARTIRQGENGAEGFQGGPVPMQGGGGVGIAPARYDHPSLPGYAWPSYAAHPNYAAVTYPKQYSPTAWPYIGPFYPYPQVPLGWRKVTLEWDDGWWNLDFKDRRGWSRKH